MKRLAACTALFLALVTVQPTAYPQADMAAHKAPAAARSTSLAITGLGGTTRTLTPDEFKALPHITVQVHNAHNGKDESYSGVPVRDLLALVPPPAGTKNVSANVQVVVASATDNFHVVLTLCDTNPDCRTGQTIVADQQDGAPLAADGAFKLIMTEDKKPARWARNLQSLTVQGVE